jgi:hypothetical protein
MTLEPTNDRGFVANEETMTDYGSSVRFGESSAAKGPCIWMWVEQQDQGPGGLKPELGQVHTHMTLAQAEEIHAKLGELIAYEKVVWEEEAWYPSE